MAYRVHMKAAAVGAVSCLLLAGCNVSVAPSATQAAGAAAAAGESAAISQSVSNISGDYVGTVQDAQGGAGAAKATLAQHKANAGGAIRDKETNQTIVVDISVSITSQNSTSGAMVVNYPPAGSGPVCTFSTTGAYDPTTNVLSGSYAAVTGCTGDTGTYQLTQQCHDTVITSTLPRRMNNPHC